MRPLLCCLPVLACPCVPAPLLNTPSALSCPSLNSVASDRAFGVAACYSIGLVELLKLPAATRYQNFAELQLIDRQRRSQSNDARVIYPMRYIPLHSSTHSLRRIATCLPSNPFASWRPGWSYTCYTLTPRQPTPDNKHNLLSCADLAFPSSGPVRSPAGRSHGDTTGSWARVGQTMGLSSLRSSACHGVSGLFLISSRFFCGRSWHSAGDLVVCVAALLCQVIVAYCSAGVL
jgi:hypothetical protein